MAQIALKPLHGSAAWSAASSSSFLPPLTSLAPPDCVTRLGEAFRLS